MTGRMRLLLPALAVIVVLRWLDPWKVEPTAPTVVEPTGGSQRVVQGPVVGVPPTGERSIEPHAVDRLVPTTSPGAPATANAFEVRGNSQSLVQGKASPPVQRRMPQKAIPSLLPVVPTQAVVEPQAPAPPPPPPLYAIGTWNDGKEPTAIFLAGPHGTLLARQGQTLLSEYTVEQINLRELVLRQLSNQKMWRLPVPNTAGSASGGQ
jgi:hypothetical protein